MSLPPGSLRSLDLQTEPVPDAPHVPVSFDQRRHVAGGDRPGSWMAIALRLPQVGFDDLASAWLRVVDRHDTLTTAFTLGEAGPVLHRVRVTGAAWEDHDTDPDPRRTVRAVFDRFCRPLASPSHRLLVLTPAPGKADARPVALIGSDHAHVDMWSLVALGRDLLAELGAAPAGAATVDSFAAHTRLLAQAPPLSAAAREDWRRVIEAGDGWMPVFPLPLGDVRPEAAAAVHVRDVFDAAQWSAFAERAAEQGVGPTGLAISCLAAATREVAGQPLRAVFPVHSRTDPRWHESSGWFITNSVLECAETNPAAGAAALRQAIARAAHPLAQVFGAGGDMPQTTGMFALSWLETRRLPVRLPADADAQYVSSVIASDDVMVWFVAGEAGLHMRYRHPDTPEAHESMGRWADAVLAALRAEVPAAALGQGNHTIAF